MGLAIGVIRDGQIAYVKGYGYVDREKDILVTEKTMFRWASMSMPVTAVVAIQLVESGQIDLDADIRKYVTNFPDKSLKITTRHLLGHLGEIVRYTNGQVIRTE